MIQGKEKKKENGETFLNRPQHPTTATEALDAVSSVPCVNAGNPVFTCMSKVEVESDQMPWDPNYQPEHPLYRTSTSSYGILSASHESAPTTFNGKSQRFSQHLGLCGMYRNHSLNTSIDKSRVYDEPHM